jgi:hypothetical protein
MTTIINQGDLDGWVKNAEKVLGSIRLCLEESIVYQYKKIEMPQALWQALEKAYRQSGLTRAFIKFKGIMDTVMAMTFRTFSSSSFFL